MKTIRAFVFFLLFLAALNAGAFSVTGNAGGRHYSALQQINQKNITSLKLAWVYHTGDISSGKKGIPKSAFENTPIFFEQSLYLCTPFGRVVALNAKTGKQRWQYDPKMQLQGHFVQGGLACRGVVLWNTRIFLATQDGRLIALDAKTGKLVSSFGKNGSINLKKGLLPALSNAYLKAAGVSDHLFSLVRKVWHAQAGNTSPPAIIGDHVIVGMSLDDNFLAKMPDGLLRSYNARTGKLEWSWNPIPKKMRRVTGAANVWAPITVDKQHGLVFVGTSSPSPDYYGVHRKGFVPYANALVALDAATGKPVWHFQTIRHDLYDYDIASQASLITVKRNGKNIPAIAQGTKTGFVFILNRLTGKPLFPIKEMPIPTSTVMGEVTAKTQPVPVLPRPLITTKLSVKNMWGLTPFDRAWCRRAFKRYRYKGMFMPPSLQGSIVFPFPGGGINWGGLAYSPKHHTIIVNYSRVAAVVKLIPRKEADKMGYVDSDVSGPAFGTPYALYRKIFLSPLGVPCSPPPWGMLAAIDVNSGQLLWKKPFGSVKKGIFYSLKRWGSPNIGGALLTASGLIFIGASMDDRFHAYDIATGKLLWHYKLPAQAAATPMTYSVNGQQYIVVAAGGGRGSSESLRGDALLAFRLQ